MEDDIEKNNHEIGTEHQEDRDETSQKQIVEPFDTIDEGSGISQAPMPRKIKKWQIIIAVIIAALLVGAASYFTYAALSSKKADVKKVATTKPAVVTKVVPDVTWIVPQKVADLGLFNTSKYRDYGLGTPIYYKIATTKDGGRLYLVQSGCGISYCNYRFKQLNNQYSFLVNESDQIYPAYDYLSGKVKVDSKTRYSELEAPKSITLSNGAEFERIGGEGFFSDLSAPKSLESTSYGNFYETLDNNKGDLATIINRNFYLKLADSTTVTYGMSLDYYSTSNYVPYVTVDGKANYTEYAKYIIPGCGSNDSTVITDTSSNMSNLKVIGSTSSGEKVYGISDSSSALAKEIYAIYKENSQNGILDTNDSTLKNLSITQFYSISPHSVFVVPDKLGDMIIFLRHEFKGAGGCGKPVVYLYPTKTTNVSVKVGADIGVSIPDYNSGWSVTAQPNGDILSNGIVYPYLFWEGQGIGQYPDVKTGNIVPRADLKNTLYANLAQLGLNKKEGNDFVNFWMTKLPKTPYVRLTWLMTHDMDQIAPLQITPKPDSVIRVFLDYEGLQKPQSIPPQKLSHITRKGFTVVEWGGLKTW